MGQLFKNIKKSVCRSFLESGASIARIVAEVFLSRNSRDVLKSEDVLKMAEVFLESEDGFEQEVEFEQDKKRFFECFSVRSCCKMNTTCG